jgi:hypothetical protein
LIERKRDPAYGVTLRDRNAGRVNQKSQTRRLGGTYVKAPTSACGRAYDCQIIACSPRVLRLQVNTLAKVYFTLARDSWSDQIESRFAASCRRNVGFVSSTNGCRDLKILRAAKSHQACNTQQNPYADLKKALHPTTCPGCTG